jgi:hypothetical protein
MSEQPVLPLPGFDDATTGIGPEVVEPVIQGRRVDNCYVGFEAR